MTNFRYLFRLPNRVWLDGMRVKIFTLGLMVSTSSLAHAQSTRDQSTRNQSTNSQTEDEQVEKQTQGTARHIYAPVVGKPHPNVLLPDIQTRAPVSLHQYLGKKVLLIHFASW